MNRFEEISQTQSKSGLLADMKFFFVHSKKWWMFPIIGLLILFGALMVLGGTAAAPFIYTLF